MSARGTVARLLDAGAPEWDAVLTAVPHDFYHLPEYVAAAAAAEGGRPAALYVTDPSGVLLVPLVIREVTGGIFDAASPYGYPGPLEAGVGDGMMGVRLARGFSLLGDLGVVAAFIRLHPLLNATATGLPGRLVVHGETVSIDLPATQADLWSQLRKNHQRDIARSTRLGFVPRMDETWEHFAAFRSMYRQTMERRGAAASYFFSDAYFRDLRSALGGRLHLCIVEGAGRVAAAGLFVETSDIVEYHLSGSDPDLLDLQPLKSMIHFVSGWASDRGNRSLHLGGGVGGANDSLFLFKAGFSPRRHAFRTLRAVLRPQAYRRLVRIAGGSALRSRHQPTFFPAYRSAGSAPATSILSRFAAAGDDSHLEIRQVRETDAEALGILLTNIDQAHFRPHAMDREGAREIASLKGRDLYLIGFVGSTPVAYGMLRGWDEGYATPSLGIGVHRDHQHRGHARAMMDALHSAALARGARQVRLRVHPGNQRAAALYASLGYRVAGIERGETLMLLDL